MTEQQTSLAAPLDLCIRCACELIASARNCEDPAQRRSFLAQAREAIIEAERHVDADVASMKPVSSRSARLVEHLRMTLESLATVIDMYEREHPPS